MAKSIIRLRNPEDLDKYEVFKRAYDDITEHTLPLVFENECPPLSLISDAVRTIVENDFVTKQAQDLIALLCHVEAVRMKLMAHTQRIVGWDDHYKQNEQKGIEVLDETDRANVEHFLSKSGPMLRKVFRKAVSGLAQLDIHELLRLSDGGTGDKLDAHLQIQERLQLYFSHYLGTEACPSDPSSRYTQAIWHCFHDDLSVEEKASLSSDGEAAIGQFINYSEYLADFSNYCIDKSLSPNIATFDYCFPPLVERQKLGRVVTFYVDGVEEVANTLTTMFSG